MVYKIHLFFTTLAAIVFAVTQPVFAEEASSDGKGEKKAPSSRPSSKKPAGKKALPRRQPLKKLEGSFALINGTDQKPETIRSIKQLYKLLDGCGLGTPIEGKALRLALLGNPHDKSFSKASRSLKKSRILYSGLKLTQAVAHLEKAQALLFKHVSQKKAKPLLLSTLSYLLLSFNSLGMESKAKESAKNLFLLNQGKAPSNVPKALWDRFKPKKPRRKTRSLKIQAPKGAVVTVDFLPPKNPNKKESEDDTVWTLKVDRGSHHIVVEMAHHQKFYTNINAGASPASVVAVLAPKTQDPYPQIRSSVAQGLLGPKNLTEKTLSTLARKTRVARFIVVHKTDSQYSLNLFERKKGVFLPQKFSLISLSPKTSKPLLKKWSIQIVASLEPPKKDPSRKIPLEKSARKAAARVTKEKPLDKKPKKKKSTPLWKKWYFWVALGAVGIVTAVFALKEDNQNTVEIRVHRP